jgi:hypothetical protein
MIHENVPSFDKAIDREFPFAAEMDTVVPWFNSFRAKP